MKSPAFQFYASDFLGGRVATYTLEEIGLYMVLLAFDWSLNGLPKDDEKLAKLTRVSVRKFRSLWAVVCENFVEREDRYFNPRLELERTKQEEWRAKSSKGGRQSATKRGARVVQPPLQPTGQPKGNTQSLSPTPVPTEKITAAPPVAARAQRPAAVRSPFDLGPYLLAHADRFPGAVVNAPHLGKVLKPLEALHGAIETLRRWRIFLAKKGEYGVDVFSRTWSEWDGEPKAPAIQTIPRPAENGDAGRVFAAIRALVRETPNPGRGVIRSIPKADVAALGDAALEAYEQIGGAERFLDPDEKVGFVLRDFTAAYRAASSHARQTA